MIAKLELITRTIKISLNNPPSLQGGSNQSLQSAYVRAINNVENRANQPNVSFNKISPRLPSTSSRSPNLSLPLLPPFSRYSINVIGPNPRWSTRSAVNRGGFLPEELDFMPFLKERRESHPGYDLLPERRDLCPPLCAGLPALLCTCEMR